MTQPNLRETLLDTTLKLRTAQWADCEAVAGLIYAVCEADGDTTVAVTPEELKNEWQGEGFNLETDAFVVTTHDDRIIGYEEFFNQHEHYNLRTDGYVHPQFKNLGIGTTLLRRVEARAREEMQLAEPDLRAFLRSTIDSRDAASHELHKAEGYSPKRYHWRMEIKLESAPSPAVFPAGVELRPFIRAEHEVAVWQAQNEAFRDHWGSHDVSFEEFTRSRFDDPEFDPSLWAIAWDGNEVAGFSLNRFRMGIGWVRTLGVRRPWRKKGLGLALLQYSFGELYKRGKDTIGLGVDASSPTGATRLYQRAGMHIASEFLTYEKELRPGRVVED
ncbi:MAG TPA: GNAT family N-acetyltransferase [Anaerolineales bacterium]|nr:GNAT family N-acetyltransferase [Anaerolineales bacterium]HNE67100.1 GNAT family N-acetyltransferase [Anaerolineales bacterium]